LTVISLFMPLILCFTVLASVSFGVLAAYIAVIGILSTFGPASKPEHARPQLILLTRQSQASGD
jgi:hypothetical protein